RSSDTLGCFQIESPGQRELLQKFQPTEWSDLIIDISLFRPGPVKSDMITPFLNRRHGREPVAYHHPLLRPALEESYGVVVYHEQSLAGVLTHEPGMYPRRLILVDARHHGIAILPLDVNASEEDYTVEVVGSEADRTRRYGIRLGLKDVHGISDAEVRSILQA